ncbi:ATP phosphoribosyltransferase regulatory subunit [Virgibacillus dakarensis]|uniref:ATP phosphoribosyltransferase regulatory subunit n=1 Tax=Virgibacillus dakarensis TaxID=1917889 RepID=UPI000B454764|nr:ATP phosphoribosyltransferase regulatory subunit [Virgibacillus dakarensis]
MLQDVFHTSNTLSLDDYQKKEYLLAKMKDRFATYGYRQIQTPAFEPYDLYQTNTGMIHPEKMVKVIDPAGKVFVLRPDVTIPITRRAAAGNQLDWDDERLFYISTVFRNASFDQGEQMQAGIENFGLKTDELDAEVIALAIHTLQDLGFEQFKLEIGHAGFFKELLKQIELSKQEIEQLQAIIQAKNVSEIEAFLENLPIQPESKKSLLQIPLLYGDPEKVIKHAESVALNNQMQEKVTDLHSLLEGLKLYDAEQFISFDLGLINHMNYYSDIIFQGFVENYGKPVLMGGRYDQLAEQFERALPAIGFAFDIAAVLQVMSQQSLFPVMDPAVDIQILYTESKRREALSSGQVLRNQGVRVRIDPIGGEANNQTAANVIYYKESQNLIANEKTSRAFFSQAELLDLFKEGF